MGSCRDLWKLEEAHLPWGGGSGRFPRAGAGRAAFQTEEWHVTVLWRGGRGTWGLRRLGLEWGQVTVWTEMRL